MQAKPSERYFFFGLLLATIIFTFFVFQPFLIIIILGACFAVVLQPVYNMFRKIAFPSWLSSLLTVLLFITLVLGPLFGIAVLIFNQSRSLYTSLTQGGIPSIENLNNSLQKILPSGVNINLTQKVNDLLGSLVNNIGSIFGATLTTLLSLLLTLLAIFYLLKDGVGWKNSLLALSPLSNDDNEKIMRRMSMVINGVVKGYLLIALLQGILMGIGFYIFSLPSPALWGVLTSVAALIPTPGTALVAVPAIIFLFVSGNTAGAVGLLVWFAAQVVVMDNFVSPRIIGRKVNIPPFLILFSILGGLFMLGPVGILLGPLSVSLLYVLISIYRSEFQTPNAS